MPENNEHKITSEDILNAFSIKEDAPISIEKTEEELKKEKGDAIINTFDKNSENSKGALEYLKEKGEKIQKKLEVETNPDKIKTLEELLSDLDKMGVELYEYSKHEKKFGAVEDVPKDIQPIVENPENEVPEAPKKDTTVENKPELEEITKLEEGKPVVVKVLGELPELKNYIDPKEKQPNPTLQELADKVEVAIKSLDDEEKKKIMTDGILGLLIKVNSDKTAANMPANDNALKFFKDDIKYIEEEAEKIKNRKEVGEKETTNKKEHDFIINTLPEELPPLPYDIELKPRTEHSKKIFSEAEKIEMEKKENLLKQLKDKFIKVSPALQEIIRNLSTKIESPDPDAKFIRLSLSDLGLKSYPNKKITLEEIYRAIDKYEKRLPDEKYGLETIPTSEVFEVCLNIEKPKFGKIFFLGTNTIKDKKGDQKIISLDNNFNKSTVTDTDMGLVPTRNSHNDPEIFEGDDEFYFKKKKKIIPKK